MCYTINYCINYLFKSYIIYIHTFIPFLKTAKTILFYYCFIISIKNKL